MASTKNRFWLRRFHSSSFSSDLDIDQSVDDPSVDARTLLAPSDPVKPRCVPALRKPIRTRSASTNFDWRPLSPVEFGATLAGGLEALRLAPDAFPFASLTATCKLLVFAWLGPRERGVAARVCKEWAGLMRTPTLWREVDLMAFPPHPAVEEGGAGAMEEGGANEMALAAYEAYRKRAIKFMSYLVAVRPALRLIRFAFDIADVRDGWLDVLQTVFRAAQCSELEHAELLWNETPAKPYVPENSSATWCTNDYKDLMYKHRHRQRFFVKFFDFFTAAAGSVTTLILPFDWTDRSLRALNRLPNLETLVLNKYFVFQSLDQSLIDTLFKSAPFLRRLTMEVWTPSGRGLQLFAMRCDTLEFLDISACRGFYLDTVALPALHTIRASICPMNGPLVSTDGIVIPCLLETLRAGAPALVCINDHRLGVAWRQESGEELEAVMMPLCACVRHTPL